MIETVRREYSQAARDFDAALEIANALGSTWREAQALLGRSALHVKVGRLAHAVSDARRAVQIAERIGHRMILGLALTRLAEAEAASGNRAGAMKSAKSALIIHQAAKHRIGLAETSRLIENLEKDQS